MWFGVSGSGFSTPMIENQMGERMGHEMKTGFTQKMNPTADKWNFLVRSSARRVPLHGPYVRLAWVD